MAEIDALLKTLKENDGSDLHLVAGLEPRIRVHGELEPLAHDTFDLGYLEAPPTPSLISCSPRASARSSESRSCDIDVTALAPVAGFLAVIRTLSNPCPETK